MQHNLASTTLVLATLALAGCTGLGGGDEAIYGSATGGTINDGRIVQAGSSTVLPLAELFAEDFGAARGVQIQVAGGGSGAGASGLCAGELDLGDMSRAMKDSEKQTCRANGIEAHEWPVAFDGLSVVVSLQNNFVDDLTVGQLADLFGRDDPVLRWNELHEAFPDQPVRLCYPDGDSGTYEYFGEVILHEESPRTGAGVQQSPDDNVLVNCLRDDPYAIGYFGYAYVVENTDSVRPIAVAGVEPTVATIADGSYSPLSRPIYIYTDEPAGIIKDYLRYVFHPEGGQALVPESGYVPLDEGTRSRHVAMLA